MKTEEKRDPSQWRITDNQGKTQDQNHCKAPSPLRIKDKPGEKNKEQNTDCKMQKGESKAKQQKGAMTP